MTVECIVQFMDMEAHKLREVGERFTVTKERCTAINSTKYGKLVREVKPRKEKAED